MSKLTVDELRRDASRIKHEMDELDRAAHGMTFDELIRIISGDKTKDTAREAIGLEERRK